MSNGNTELDDPGKKTFLKKFGRRVGNVFTKKRNSRASSYEEDFPLPPSQSSGVIRNPLMDADIPSPDVYVATRPYQISAQPMPRAGGRVRSGFYSDMDEFASVTPEVSVGALGPPERCLSEGNLVESTAPPRSDPLGGRVWRAVPGSMDNLPKSLLGELSRKINTRAQSGSEDEGLPHSPPTDAPMAAEAVSSSIPVGPSVSLSQSSKSLISCGDSSDGERGSMEQLDLDFNVLRRAESLDNTAAKHKIQVGRQRRKSSGTNAGGLRKHKSCTTVQLAGISEEEPQRRPPPGDMGGTGDPDKRSSNASRLAQELQQMKKKDREGAAAFPAPSAAIPIIRSGRTPSSGSASAPTAGPTPAGSEALASSRVNTAALAASRIERLRSMFVTSDLSDAPTAAKPLQSAMGRSSGPEKSGPSRVVSLTGAPSAASPSVGLAKASSVSLPAAKTADSPARPKFSFTAVSKTYSLPSSTVKAAAEPSEVPKSGTGSSKEQSAQKIEAAPPPAKVFSRPTTISPSVPSASPPLGSKIFTRPSGSSSSTPTSPPVGPGPFGKSSSTAPTTPPLSKSSVASPSKNSSSRLFSASTTSVGAAQTSPPVSKTVTGAPQTPPVPTSTAAKVTPGTVSASAVGANLKPLTGTGTASRVFTSSATTGPVSASQTSSSKDCIPSSPGPVSISSNKSVSKTPPPSSASGSFTLSSSKTPGATRTTPTSMSLPKATNATATSSPVTNRSKLPGSTTFSAGPVATSGQSKKVEMPTSRPPVGAANSTAANNKAAFTAGITAKTAESSAARGDVLLRDKKATDSDTEDASGRRVSRVMDLVRNFQRLQESSTT